MNGLAGPLSREQVREVDRRAVADYGMTGLVLMENAGRGVADAIQRLGIAGPVLIACGKGNNAGDGFVIARHLDFRGYAVEVLVWAAPDELAGDAGANYRILEKAGVPMVCYGGTLDEADLFARLTGKALVVDALLGTGARGEPRPPLDRVIDLLNACGAAILAVDLPSGLDCDTGRASSHTIRAARTCTFVAPKPGFLVPRAAAYTGTVEVLDIGVPRRLLEEIAIFSRNPS